MHTLRKTHGKYATRGIYMYMYACLFRQERPTYTINHAKFFAQFIRVADTKYGFLLTRVAKLLLNASDETREVLRVCGSEEG